MKKVSSKFENYWRKFIWLVCILLMIFPISSYFWFEFEDSTGTWTNAYIFNSWEYALFYLPLFLLIFLIPKTKRFVKIALIFISLGLGLFASFYAIFTTIIPIQDATSHVGMLISVFLFPIMIINSIVEWEYIPNPNKDMEEEILDAFES